MPSLPNWRWFVGVAVLALLAFALWKAHDLGGAPAREQAQTERLEMAKKTIRLLDKVSQDSADLQSSADALGKVKNEKIRKLNLANAAALERLRERPERPGGADMSTNTSAGPALGGTGAGLYREDGEFLTGEAARAQTALVFLAQCQAAYAKVKSKVNGE